MEENQEKLANWPRKRANSKMFQVLDVIQTNRLPVDDGTCVNHSEDGRMFKMQRFFLPFLPAGGLLT